jgi:hypothetical protein
MTRAGWWKSLAATLALVLAVPVQAAPLPEDRSALSQVPATSPLVVYLHGVEGSADRLIAYLKNALPDLGGIAETAIKGFLENGYDGRKLRGLVKEGPIFLAFDEMPKEGETPKFAVLLAVKDYKAFRDGILTEEEQKALKPNPKGYEEAKIEGKEVFFVERKGYAVVTTEEKTAVAYTKKAVGLDTKISKEQTDRLLSADLGVYLSMDVVNKDYAEQIKSAKEQIQDALKALEEGPGKNERGLFEAARNFVGPVFQAVEDSRGAMVTLEARPTAIVLHVESELRPNTKTAAALKEYKPVALEDVDRLPTGQVFYSALMTNADLFKLVGPLAVGVTLEGDGKEAKAVKAAMEQLAKAGPGLRLEASGLPTNGVQTWQFADAPAALAAQVSVLTNLGKGDTFSGGVIKEKSAVKKGAAKFKDIEFHSVSMVWDLEKMAASAAPGTELPEEVQKKMAEGFKKILGEQTTVWVGADDKRLITVTAPDWNAARDLLQQTFKVEEAVGQKKGFQELRKELPSGAMLAGAVDVVAYGTAMAEVFKPVAAGFGFPLPAKFPAALPKGDPSFVGAAVTLNEKRLALDTVVTASAVRDVYKAFVAPLLGRF